MHCYKMSVASERRAQINIVFGVLCAPAAEKQVSSREMIRPQTCIHILSDLIHDTHVQAMRY